VWSVLVHDRWTPSRQVNSQLSLLPHKDKDVQRWHDERENNEINRLDKPGNTSHHTRRVADVVGGPRTHRGWGGNAGSIHTNAGFDTCAQQPAAVSSRPVLGRIIRRADTVRHTQQPLITVGDITIVEHFVK